MTGETEYRLGVRETSDKQLTGMAGEFLVVGQLFKREIQASLTIGNAKGVDVLAFNPSTGKTFTVEVKTVRKPNSFIIKSARIQTERIYVFVVLNAPGCPEAFYIVPGAEILANLTGFFGGSLMYADRQAINRGPLAQYKDNWKAFEA
uniref:PD(D/E)XK endonuclease domain-containing protein n=1 Tax=Thiomonas intermedia (strain K12) TaxID=75379 RepID=D5WYT0_THIK1